MATTESENDRLSALSDNILSCNIFSHLSLTDVVRTSVLSSRWRFLWKQIPHLIFSDDFFESLKLPSGIQSGWPWNENLEQKERYIKDIIDSIFLHHSGHIERFSIHQTSFSFESRIWKRLPIDQWIHHAALKEVKQLSISMSFEELDMPSSVFACHLLRDLQLESLRFTEISTEFAGFCFLESCSLSYIGNLTDDGLKQLIGLCPVLQKLALANCLQLHNLKIEAPNLNFLNIVGCHNMESLIADCPQLVELAIKDCQRLIEFRVSSCVLFNDRHISDVQIPKQLPMRNSLQKLFVRACPKVVDLPLLTTFVCFRTFEQVDIMKNNSLWQICEEDHSEQDKAKGEVVADSAFQSLKKAYVYISSAMKEEEAIMLTFLLSNAPSLNTITITLPYCYEDIHNKKFIDKVLDLQQLYEKVDIRMEIDKQRLDTVCELYDLDQPETLNSHDVDFYSDSSL